MDLLSKQPILKCFLMFNLLLLTYLFGLKEAATRMTSGTEEGQVRTCEFAMKPIGFVQNCWVTHESPDKSDRHRSSSHT